MDFQIDGNSYSTSGRWDAFTQLNVARKLAPAMPIMDGMVATENQNKDKRILSILIFSRLNDRDSEFVISKCLSLVSRKQQDGSMAKVQTPDGHLMFNDIDVSVILQLSSGVIEENLGDFFRTSLGTLEAT